jgi:hypothetical protein
MRRGTFTATVGAFVATALLFVGCGGGICTEAAQPSWTGFAVQRLPSEMGALSATFTKHTSVFGVDIVATAGTPDDKVLHAANVLAQYLDNDEDSTPDDPAVIDALRSEGAILLMPADGDELERLDFDHDLLDGRGGQDLWGSETAQPGRFDVALEEVHHLLMNSGWSKAYPDQLGQRSGSALADAMDIARGGRFESVPAEYPTGAWYSYDDSTCDYDCMVTEYSYWAHTSLVGAQADRADEIGQEWRAETSEKMRQSDRAASAIFDDAGLRLPTRLPDGSYSG